MLRKPAGIEENVFDRPGEGFSFVLIVSKFVER